jgi:hypothetical protein
VVSTQPPNAPDERAHGYSQSRTQQRACGTPNGSPERSRSRIRSCAVCAVRNSIVPNGKSLVSVQAETNGKSNTTAACMHTTALNHRHMNTERNTELYRDMRAHGTCDSTRGPSLTAQRHDAHCTRRALDCAHMVPGSVCAPSRRQRRGSTTAAPRTAAQRSLLRWCR